WAGSPPLAVLMLPLATTGSTRFWPLTDAYVGLARHFHTGAAVSACALGTTHSAPVIAASATRSLRVILVSPMLLWMDARSPAPPSISVVFAANATLSFPPVGGRWDSAACRYHGDGSSSRAGLTA